MAEAWEAHVRGWLELTADLEGPDGAERYFVFQTLVGAWPIEMDRLEAYLEKALREAKLRTSWVEPDTAYEEGVKRYACALLEDSAFLEDFEPFAERVAVEGRRAALGQLLLKLTSPGVPDIYQGNELEALSLVDPDNRRPVDWEARSAALARLRNGEAPRDYGETKLLFILRALEVRARRPESFDGAYDPLKSASGICAFLRGRDVLVMVPIRDWSDAKLSGAEGVWRDVFSGESQSLAASTPVAPLIAQHGVGLFHRADAARSTVVSNNATDRSSNRAASPRFRRAR
jgi:(1->4)-alpha-D-glucan 1-alpha-D-glucosylmutase